MNKSNLTISVPGIRPEKWLRLLDSIPASIGDYTYEVIFSGPYEPNFALPNNCRFEKNFAHPTKCVQQASLIANGELFTWMSDDGVYLPRGLYEAIKFWYSDKKTENDEVVLRYFEGINFAGNYQGQPIDGPRQSYWHAHFHPNLQLPYIPYHYRVAPIGLLSLATFYRFGGFDCRFEHINMSCIDLSVRIQKFGAGVYLSPETVSSCDFTAGDSSAERSPVVQAYIQNDNPLFTRLYTDGEREPILDLHNYREIPDVWARRQF